MGGDYAAIGLHSQVSGGKGCMFSMDHQLEMEVVLNPVQEGHLEVRGPEKKDVQGGVISDYSEERYICLYQEK